MRYLVLFLLLVGCMDKPLTLELDETIKLSEDCQRLINDSYEDWKYPDDECRCFFVKDGDGWKYSHKWTLKEYQMWQDSAACFYERVEYGPFTIIPSTMIINGQVLECDCE